MALGIMHSPEMTYITEAKSSQVNAEGVNWTKSPKPVATTSDCGKQFRAKYTCT